MKTYTILMAGILLAFCKLANAQNDPLNRKITFESKEITFSELRTQVEKQLELSFIFNSALVKNDNKVSLPSNTPTLKQALDALVKNQSFNYSLKGKNILLKKRKAGAGKKSKNSISGYIRDASTNEILIGATVYLMELKNGTISNNYGYYSLTVPEGDYTLRVSYIGFEPLVKQISISGKTPNDILLAPALSELEDVVVEAVKDDIINTAEVGVANISTVQLKNQPSLLGEPDLLRVLLTLPGVNNIGEGGSGFNVRGGNTDQNLIILDEAPIFNSSHLFGLFSVFNSDAIKSSKLYKGIPARYGGRASSVLDIHQKDGNNKFGGSFSLGGIIERAMIEGPTVKDKGSFLVAGRLFNPLLSILASSASDTGDKSVFGFYDVNAKISHKLSESSKLLLSLYSSKDQFSLDLDDNETTTLKWANHTATLRWNKIFSPQLFSNFTGLFSNYNYLFKEKFRESEGKWEARINNFTFKSDFQYFPSANHLLEFGLQSNFTQISPGDIQGSIGTFRITETEPGESQHGLESSVYASLESQITDKLQIQAGLRYTVYGFLGKGSVNTYVSGEPLSDISINGTKVFGKGEWIETYSGFEPRLLLSYRISDNMAIKANYQRVNQYLQQISNTSSTLPIDIWKLSDSFVKPLQSDSYSTGLYWTNNRLGLQASVEGYYRTLNNFIEYKNGANLYLNSHIETELLSGKGRAYGIELFLAMKSKKTDAQLAYTYSRSIRRVEGEFREETINGGNEYPSNFDQPHILSLSIHRKLNERWDVNTLFTYKTGRPITLPGSRYVLNRIEGDLSDSEITDQVTKPAVIYEYNERNNFRIPDFHRVDLSFNYRPRPKRKTQAEWSFGMYNLYGRKNAFSIAFNSSSEVSNSVAQKVSIIGIPVPYVSYSLKF